MTENSKQALPLLIQFLDIRGMGVLPAYSNNDVAKVFDCSSRTVLNYVHRGLLKPRCLPGRKNFLPCDLEELLARRSSL